METIEDKIVILEKELADLKREKSRKSIGRWNHEIGEEYYYVISDGSTSAQDVDAGLLEALKKINTMACYSSEEDIDSREEVLIMIGNAARKAIARAKIKTLKTLED